MPSDRSETVNRPTTANTTVNKPELLAPAGSLNHMKFAYAYGADAVYAGIPRYSLRVRNNSFREEQLREGIHHAHTHGKQFYIAANIAPHNDKIKTFLADLGKVLEGPKSAQPDALIMSDPGLIMMVRERYPSVPIHLSVQANVVNWATAKFWHEQGIERIILSRELGLKEIEHCIQQVPEMEFEVFVHGALCIAYSGRCLLSGYMNHRDANQGACTNACRWNYTTSPAEETAEGHIVKKVDPAKQAPENHIAIIEERTKPGESMVAYEDEHGSYIMNSKDLRAVQHIEPLMAMGIHSLKIEGRTKSHYYVARTCQVYRKVIEETAMGKPFDFTHMDELEKLSNRGYTEGFFRRHPPGVYQNYEQGTSLIGQHQFVGEILDYNRANGRFTVKSKNQFQIDDTLELMTPQGNIAFTLQNLENQNGESLSRVPGSDHVATFTLPDNALEADDHRLDSLEFGLLIRESRS